MNVGLLSLVFITMLSACGQTPDDTIRFGLAKMPANLDPRYATDAASSRIDRLLYQRLVEFDNAKLPIAGIADWTMLSPTHYRFVLNEQKRNFHNGDKLTSNDVKQTYDYVLDEKNASPHRGILKLIKSISTPDDNTIEFLLDHQDPLFPAYLVIGILPKNLLANDYAFERKPVGSGLFAYVDWPEGGKLKLKRETDGQLVEFMEVANPTVRVLKLLRGEIDLVQNDLLPELIQFLDDKKEVVIQKQQGSNFAYLGFNLEDPVLQKRDVRQAIAYAINRKEIIRYVFGNSAREANALLPPDHWAGNPAIVPYEYNPEKAKALLRAAGITEPLKFTYKTSSDPFRIRLATILQNQFKQVNITIDIRSYDWGTFYGDVKNGRFQLYSLAWVGVKTPDIFRYAFHSDAIPPAGANRGRFRDREIDTLIESAESKKTLAEQASYFKQIQQRLQEELPSIPLWYEDHIFIARKNIEHYKIGLDGNYDGLFQATKTRTL